MSEVITRIVPSVPRRAFICGMLCVLGALLSYAALTQAASLIWGAILLALGILLLWSGSRMWQVSGRRIELTEDVLRLSDGTLICKTSDMKKVDRSLFAFKPSNGFLLTLNAPSKAMWVPGLCWRIGKRIGIGGLTPGAEAKIMADTISAMIATRDGLLDDLTPK